MRFEPRLLRPDDEPDDSLELPADLEELAEQLSADADYLAARFPPAGTGRPRGSAGRLEGVSRSDGANELQQPSRWQYTGPWHNARPAKPVEDNFGRGLVRGAAAAVLLTGIGLWGGRIWSALGTHPPRTTQAAASREAIVSQASESARVPGEQRDASSRPNLQRDTAGAATLNADKLGPGELAGDGFAGDGPAAGAALPFRSLSGGEQEGVLDLLEEQPLEEAQISI
jgi:hypothetical protein